MVFYKDYDRYSRIVEVSFARFIRVKSEEVFFLGDMDIERLICNFENEN